MCDYSLEHADNRPAEAGDRLFVTSFPGSTTRGFSDADHPEIAVCLKPGTELVFDKPVMFSGLFAFLLQAYSHDCRTARFRHVNENNRFVHHDALEFANGQVVLLTHLRSGQAATVLQLPAEPGRRHEQIAAKEQPRHAPALA